MAGGWCAVLCVGRNSLQINNLCLLHLFEKCCWYLAVAVEMVLGGTMLVVVVL